jgi:prepilin-type N-terminal cleavage/methylation domain-containing protein/prepilin-type processing-associated H-X9-DG protein
MKNLTTGAKNKAFTLIELLVVIAIIALLLAILVPGLKNAQDLAYRIKCGSNLKNIVTASNTYANSQNGYFVPAGHVGGRQAAKLWGDYDYNLGDRFWYQIKAFRDYLDIGSYIAGSNLVTTLNEPLCNESFTSDLKAGANKVTLNLKTMPKKFLCPADKISKEKSDTDDRISYGYNNTDWRPWTIKYRIVGYKASNVKNPAGTLNLIDNIDFWCDINGAHYAWVWDRIKGYSGPSAWPEDIRNEIADDTVFYRHNEGAVVGFYDGHSQWLKKQEIFDREGYNIQPSSDARMGMWTATGRIIPGWLKRWSN